MSPSEAADRRDRSPSATRPSAREPAGTRWRLFPSELHLVFGRARTWVLLAVLAAVPVLVGVAIKLSGTEGGAEGFIGQVAGNGFFLIVASLALSLPFFLPTAVTVDLGGVAGR